MNLKSFLTYAHFYMPYTLVKCLITPSVAQEIDLEAWKK